MKNKSEYISLEKGLAIYKLAQSNNWYIRLRHEKAEYKRSLKISCRKEAENEARFLYMAIERDLGDNILVKPSKKLKTVISELLDIYDKERKDLQKSYQIFKDQKKQNGYKKLNRYKELQRYINILTDLKNKFGGVNIKEVDYAHLLSFYRTFENKISKTQVRYMNLAIKHFFNYCLENRLLKTIPPTPKIKTKVGEVGKYFTNCDYNLIINKLKNREVKKGIETENNKLLLQAFSFVTETGIRPGKELTNIQCSDISVEEIQRKKYWVCQIKGGKIATKNNVKRKIIISPKAIYLLKEILSDVDSMLPDMANVDAYFIRVLKDHKDRYLFRRKSGFDIDYSTLFSNLKKDISDELIEKDLKMYSCRHTYITNQLKRNANINIIAKHCGTSVEMIEKHYNHLLSIMKPSELLDELYNVETQIEVLPNSDITIITMPEIEESKQQFLSSSK